MDKYLLAILKDVNTIIIPGLGALTLVNADTGEYMFMPFLKHDDGQLAEYIAEKEGMEVNDAKNLIAKYVREIQSTLDKGEDYDMYQFGSFYKNGDDVGFRGFTAESLSDGNNEVVDNKVSEEEIEQEVESILDTNDPIIEESSSKDIENEIVPETEPLVEEEEVPYEEAIEALEELLSEENEAKINTEVTSETSNDTQSEDSSDTNKVLTIVEKEEIEKGRKKLKELKAIQENKSVKKKRTPAFWMLIILLIVIIGGGTMFALNYNEWKQHIPFLADHPQEQDNSSDHKEKMEEILGLDNEDEPEENVQDELESEQSDNELEELTSEEVEEVIEQEITPEPVRTNGSFHAIAGAFGSKENADRLVTKLKEQGYPAFVAQRGTMNWVSMKQFATKEEANAAISELKGIVPQVWVFEGNL